MEAFFVGLFTIIIGTLLIFAGFQFFRILMPLWGLFAGFMWSAQGVSIAMGTGFLTTVLSWVVGILVGFIFAIFAYVFYDIAAAILVGFLSYWLIGSFMIISGVPGGVLLNLVSSLSGIVLGALAVYLKAPKKILIVLTALGGSTMVVGGFLVMFGQLPLSILGSDVISAFIVYSFGFTVLWASLTLLGVIAQMRISEMMNIEETGYPSDFIYSGIKGGKATRHTRHQKDASK